MADCNSLAGVGAWLEDGRKEKREVGVKVVWKRGW